MKKLLILLIPITAFCFNFSAAQTAGSTTSFGIFDGRTPCQQLASQLDEKTTPECIKIKWRLVLYKDASSGEPAHFELTGFVYKRGDPATGRWHIIKGTNSDPNAIIYQLDLGGKKPMYFLKADENILFFLDDSKNILVGNRDFSYTLNRRK